MAYRHLIVDGYCLLHRDPVMARDLPRRLVVARQQLLRLVEQTFPLLAERATVVFDHRGAVPPDPSPELGVDVVYAAADQTADTVIERLVQAAPTPARVLVVTSDHLEAQTVSAAGADVMSCPEFLDRARRASPSGGPRRNSRQGGPTLADFFPEA